MNSHHIISILSANKVAITETNLLVADEMVSEANPTDSS